MPQQTYLAPFAEIETPGENPPLVARRSRRGSKFLVYPNNFSKSKRLHLVEVLQEDRKILSGVASLLKNLG